MTMTSLEPTSRCAILPSGETLDLVRPGISSVVGRRRGVEVAELLRVRVLQGALEHISAGVGVSTYSRGDPGFEGAGVSLRALPTPCLAVA